MTADVNCCTTLDLDTEDEIRCYPRNTADVDIHSDSFCLQRKNRDLPLLVKAVVEYVGMREKNYKDRFKLIWSHRRETRRHFSDVVN